MFEALKNFTRDWFRMAGPHGCAVAFIDNARLRYFKDGDSMVIGGEVGGDGADFILYPYTIGQWEKSLVVVGDITKQDIIQDIRETFERHSMVLVVG